MKLKNTAITLFGALALSLSASSFAATLTDTIDASSGQTGTYFVPSAGLETTSPYYRWNGDDWGWTHNALSGTLSDAKLNISAYDVDAPREQDDIYAYNNDTASWTFLGSLAGNNNVFSFTEFSLDSSWYDEIAAGLQVRMVIDVLDDGWAVSLAKSVLTVNGGTVGNPNPGVNEVPVPAAAFLFAPALLGFMALRRKAKSA
jgi:hypothetical protein